MQQKSISCSFIPANTPLNTVNYEPKLKSVKFAQELVNTKTFSSNSIKIKDTTRPILKSALRISNKQQPETEIINQNKLL